MKNKLLTIILTLSFLSAGELGGYSIFEYNNSAFEINRVYLQYTDNLSEELFLKIRYDVGRDEPGKDGKFETYLKNAYVDWDLKDVGKISLGLISTNSYSVQESNWGYRFIAKSVPDMYKFTNTADLGIGVSRQIGDFNLSFQALNGEGYKNKAEDETFSSYVRLVYGETKLKKNDGYNVGLVYNNNSNTDETLFGIFAGYSSKEKNLRAGFDYNVFETVGMTEQVVSAYSIFKYQRNEKVNILFRFDRYSQEDVLNSEVDKVLIGLVFNPIKSLYISPNVAMSSVANQDDYDNDFRLTFMFKY